MDEIPSDSTVEWLKRSLVYLSDQPRDASCLANAILFELPMCLKMTDMGMFKFVLTFESQEEAHSVSQEYRDVLSYWFYAVNPWDDLDACEMRRVWLELYGIPGHAWAWENIQNIVQCWGDLVCVDSTTREVKTFSVARALVDTKCMSAISGQVLLQVQQKGYRVFIQKAKAPICSYNNKQKHDQDDREATPNYQSTDEEDGYYRDLDVNNEGVEQSGQDDGSERILETCHKGNQNPLEPNSVFWNDEKCVGNVAQIFTSRTLLDSTLGKENQILKVGGCIKEPTFNYGNLDSEATIVNSQCEQSHANGNQLGNST